MRTFAELLRGSRFRTLWAGMSLSYAGDRLQELAQGWLVAQVTRSAMAVGGIGIVAAIPLLLMPLGGVLADRMDRRRIVVVGQGAGAIVAGCVALLVATDNLALWHVYAWALVSGLIWMAIRPAYKVILTHAVAAHQVRAAVGLNSVTEIAAVALVSAGGGLLIRQVGLTIAFVLNALTYAVAAVCVASLRGLDSLPAGAAAGLSASGVWADLRQGIAYLGHTPELLRPLALSLAFIVLVSPTSTLLAAIVHGEGGSVTDLGLLGAAGAIGALAGAILAATRPVNAPGRTYALFGLIAAAAMVLFVSRPLAVAGYIALAVLGVLAFSQAVWNTSRVAEVAAQGYQARLQAITSMAFTLGSPVGSLWGGLVVDGLGLPGLMIGAGVLGTASAAALLVQWHRARTVSAAPEG
jgi:predicted MFS family arabinose efflux permease